VNKISWSPMNTDGRLGVNICEIFNDISFGEHGSRLAILNYEPGAIVPKHLHTGYEMIFMIDGELSDDYGTYSKGDLVAYQPNSEHSLSTRSGCTFLVLWEKPAIRIQGDA
jgi:anti-sigma factor ChrR (cupin superfamily)